MNDVLDSQDFYEVCQQYRHAEHAFGSPTAPEAFEELKKWIREMQSFIHSPEEIANASAQSDFS